MKRVLFRSGVLVILLLIGLSLPSFGAILNLIGATTITLLNFVFPPLFYLMLDKKHNSGSLYDNIEEEGTSAAAPAANQSPRYLQGVPKMVPCSSAFNKIGTTSIKDF